MSNEQIKTAPADRSSVKPLQSVAVSYRLSYWLPHDVSRWLPVLICVMCRPRLACLPLTHPLRSSVSPVVLPCVSCLCSLLTCLSRFDASLRHAYPSGMSVSFRPLASPCLLSPLPRVDERGDVGRSDRLGRYFFSCVIFARSGAFLGVRVL